MSDKKVSDLAGPGRGRSQIRKDGDIAETMASVSQVYESFVNQGFGETSPQQNESEGSKVSSESSHE